ncbi:MAG: ABC transporter permease [Anaerolineae bacterium]
MQFGLATYLASKEIWRNRLRFLLVSIFIALIAVLVLFTAALAEGLGSGNRQFIEKLNADLIVYQDRANLQIPSSRMDQSTIRSLRRVEGVSAVGPLAFSNAFIIREGKQPLQSAIIGIVPGEVGEPPIVEGRKIQRSNADEAIIDANVARQAGLKVGDTLTLRSVQGTEEKFYDLNIVGMTDARSYGLAPSVILPSQTWDKVRPKGASETGNAEVEYNVAAVKLDNPARQKEMAKILASQVANVTAVDKVTAYSNTPGYEAQQSTLNTQQFFAFLIGALVIGGFFQIQLMQRVAQIGMLKAIGTSNGVIGIAFLLQIIIITALGVFIGGAGVLLVAQFLPPVVPIVFSPKTLLTAVGALMIIGPLGGLVAVRSALKVEPLTALRLA